MVYPGSMSVCLENTVNKLFFLSTWAAFPLSCQNLLLWKAHLFYCSESQVFLLFVYISFTTDSVYVTRRRTIGLHCVFFFFFLQTALPAAETTPLFQTMSDLILVLLIVVLLLCLVVTVGGYLLFSGLLSDVVIKTGPPPVKNVTIAYKFREGSYKDCGAAYTETCSIGPKLSTVAVFYDDPKQVRPQEPDNRISTIHMT